MKQLLAIYVMYYGVASYTGYSFWYGVVVFGFPALCFYQLANGMVAWGHLKHMDDDEYYTSLEGFDDSHFGNTQTVRRRHFRGFRGFGGYGGSGRGGYHGGGYRGHGGGFGGGFGG